MADFNKYQQKAIKNYYDNRDAIDEQRLSELVTNLFLAEGKKQAKMWEKAEDYMTRLGVPQSRVDHIISSGSPTILAELVKDLQAGVVTLKPPKAKPKK